MTITSFDPADPATWRARGRSEAHADCLAAAWRAYPDLPFDAPIDDKNARTRERVAALRPVHDAIAAAGEQQREAGNFAFAERQAASGKADDRSVAILRGRDEHGYGWDAAVRYADGWYAAHAGWERRAPGADNRGRVSPALTAAYDRGFADGGGCADDLFDTARRANLAALRRSNQPPLAAQPKVARPRPSAWPLPSDAPRPTSWPRRLLVVEECAAQVRDHPLPALRMFDGEQFRALRACTGHEAAAIAILTTRHGIVSGDAIIEPYTPAPTGEAIGALARDPAQAQRLAAIATGRDIEDILIAATDPYFALVDAHAGALPLCRTMARTRNTVIQRRSHLRTWLARGLLPGQTLAAGHIRWGKVHAGLRGSLGEFTARYAGPLPRRGHAIVVEHADGAEATGYHDAAGMLLIPRITVSSKARLRPAIASALRSFAAATRLAT